MDSNGRQIFIDDHKIIDESIGMVTCTVGSVAFYLNFAHFPHTLAVSQLNAAIKCRAQIHLNDNVGTQVSVVCLASAHSTSSIAETTHEHSLLLCVTLIGISAVIAGLNRR